jgi:hypothetical protein
MVANVAVGNFVYQNQYNMLRSCCTARCNTPYLCPDSNTD